MGRHVVCVLHIELLSGRISEEDKIQCDRQTAKFYMFNLKG